VHLVDDLLDISRITQGKIKLRRERIELKTAIEMALETSRGLIDEAENELTLTLPQKPIFINADLTRVAQIFLNILNNAAKYSDKGGKFRCTAKPQNGNAVVSIKDTGLGIPPEMLAENFRYVRSDRNA
jgi:signal transduction histidine kinase